MVNKSLYNSFFIFFVADSPPLLFFHIHGKNFSKLPNYPQTSKLPKTLELPNFGGRQQQELKKIFKITRLLARARVSQPP